MRRNRGPAERESAVSRQGISRRHWLQGTACAVGLAAVSASPLPAQDPKLLQAARAMSAMLGAELAEPWLAPTTVLVGVILDYSQILRALDLGELEPATFYVAR